MARGIVGWCVVDDVVSLLVDVGGAYTTLNKDSNKGEDIATFITNYNLPKYVRSGSKWIQEY